MRKKEPPENFAELQKEKTVGQIAEDCGVCRCTARRWLKTIGVRKKNGVSGRPVFALDPSTGKLVRRYSSLREASEDLFVHSSAISAALNGRAKTAAGYRWECAE